MSLAKLGYEPWVIDCINARDTQRIAHTMLISQRDYPHKLPAMIEKAPKAAPIMMAGNLENYPDLWEALSFGREIFGSNANAIRAARQVGALSEITPPKGIKHPKIKLDQGLFNKLNMLIFGNWDRKKYLSKPIASAGGMGIHFWEKGTSIGKDRYLQQYIPGTPIGTVFRADGWSVQLLGACETLVGESAFGADNFNYVGNIGELQLSEKARAAISQIAVAMTQRHDLRGIFGIDFVMDFSGKLWPIEINPRYTASVEVLERSKEFAAYDEVTSPRKKKDDEQPQITWGKALVRAKQDCITPDLFKIFPEKYIANIPQANTTICKGTPICTVFADALTRDEVFKSLKEKAQQVYDSVTPT